MLNVVRSAVITSSRRTSLTPSICLDRISYRLTSNNVDDEPQQPHQHQSDQYHQAEALRQVPAKKIDRSKVPVVNEADLDERFISGSGPGGQKVNKATNCCQIRHIPTGIVVKVHQSRSLDQNRKIARELLAQRLDNLYNGDESVASQSKRIALQKIATRESMSQKRRDMKEQFRRRLEAENSD